MYKICHCKEWKKNVTYILCLGYTEKSNKNITNLVKTERSDHQKRLLGELSPCCCGSRSIQKVKRDDNIITLVAIWTTELLMTWEGKNSNGHKVAATKNLGRLSFLLFLLKNSTHLSILVLKILLILMTPLFTAAVAHTHISYLPLCMPYSSVMFHF